MTPRRRRVERDTVKLNLILPAAGSGSRMKTPGDPKQFREINGVPLVYRSLMAFQPLEGLSRIVVATQPAYFSFFRPDRLERFGLRPVRLVAGGKERVDSVRNALQQVEADADFVIIHDAARPFIHPEDLRRVVRKAVKVRAAILVRPVIPTIKRVDTAGRMVETLDRECLVEVETPQVFERELILRAHHAYQGERKRATDDAYLVEQLGEVVVGVQAKYKNLKITKDEDWKEMEKTDSLMQLRVGNGYDIHRLMEGRRLVLGGVELPSKRGCLGHSDGDVLTHAIIDALLGAMGKQDIGVHFPNSDKRFKDISSMTLLKKVTKMVKKASYRIVNIDATIICERPQIAPHRSAMIESLASSLEIEKGQLSIKAKTNEGLDSQGHSYSISVHAVALVLKDQ